MLAALFVMTVNNFARVLTFPALLFKTYTWLHAEMADMRCVSVVQPWRDLDSSKDEWIFVRLYTIFMDEVNFIPTDANGQLTYRPIQNTKGIYFRLV